MVSHCSPTVVIITDAPSGANFNFPKLHMLEHYAKLICMFGTTDNYNTEATERLHIDFIKDAFKATSRRSYDFIEQMALWLERREKVHVFDVMVTATMGNLRHPKRFYSQPTGRVTLAKGASATKVPIGKLVVDYAATNFEHALRRFIQQFRKQKTQSLLRRNVADIPLPSTFDIWHRVKFQTTYPSLSEGDGQNDTHDIADAAPLRLDSQKRHMLPARFDTVFIDETGAEETGIDGEMTTST